MRIFVLAIYFSFFSFQAYSQNEIDSLISQGRYYAYNLNLKAAEESFLKAIEKGPNNLKGYYFISQTYLWSYLKTKDQGDLGVLNKFADMCISLGEKLLETDEENYENKFYLGSAHQLKAVSLMYRGEFFEAFGDVSDAVTYFEETLELNPEFYDAYLGLGIFSYTLSYIPGFYRFLLSILGLSSDREEGLAKIKLVSEKGKINKHEAQFYLARIYTDYLAEYDTSASILEKLNLKFPKNTVLLYQYAMIKIYQRELEKSEKTLDKIIRINNDSLNKFRKTKLDQIDALTQLRKADIHFKRNQFEKAANYYNRFIELARSYELTGYAYYQLALCNSIMDNKLDAQQNLLFARNGNLEVADDKYAKLKSEFFYKNGFSEEYLSLTKLGSTIETGDYEHVYNELKLMKQFFKSRESIVRARYYLAEASFKLGMYDEAFSNLDGIEKYELSYDEWVIPASLILKSEIFYKIGKPDQAKEMLNEADDFSDYEFEELFNAKMNQLKRKVELK